MAATVRQVRCGEEIIRYELTRKAVKNLNLRVHPDGRICVSAHPQVPLREVDAFVAGRADFIRKAVSRFEGRREDVPTTQYADGEKLLILGEEVRLHVARAARDAAVRRADGLHLNLRSPDDAAQRRRLAERYLTELCRAVFLRVVQQAYEPFRQMGVDMPQLRIRAMKSRWGSCMPRKGIITLNWHLVKAPEACIFYVANHELCHLIHPDHQAGFHALQESLLPDWRERRAMLNRLAPQLM